MAERVEFKPIGVVLRGLDPDVDADRYNFVSTIRVFDEFVEGLSGLESYSHIIVVYYLHMAGEWSPRVRFKGRELGVFATRSPFRPNPIGVSVARVESIRPPYLEVSGLDAWSGSPVLDLKPYDLYDIVCNPSIPDYAEHSFSDKKRMGLLPDWVGPC